MALGIVNACARAEDVLGGVGSSSKGAGMLVVEGVKTVTAAVCATPPEQVKGF